MICIPSFFIIVLLQMGFITLIALVTSEVIYSNIRHLDSINSSDFVQYVKFELLIYVLFSLWSLTVMYNFGQTILYKTFITWYRATEKNPITFGMPFISAASLLRYIYEC